MYILSTYQSELVKTNGEDWRIDDRILFINVSFNDEVTQNNREDVSEIKVYLDKFYREICTSTEKETYWAFLTSDVRLNIGSKRYDKQNRHEGNGVSDVPPILAKL